MIDIVTQNSTENKIINAMPCQNRSLLCSASFSAGVFKCSYVSMISLVLIGAISPYLKKLGSFTPCRGRYAVTQLRSYAPLFMVAGIA
jgi:hypothetical protein